MSVARSSRGRFALRVLGALAALVALVFTAAMVAVLWSDPVFATAPDTSPEALAATGIDFSQPYTATPREFRVRDGVSLHAQGLATTGAAAPRVVVVLVHGLLGSGYLLNRCSGLLQEALGASSTEVWAIDLRGHGASGGAPGDVDYIGQYEDDVLDVAASLHAAHPAARIVLAGHSMGGGIVLRALERLAEHGRDRARTPVDGALLLAPYLGWSSPTVPKEVSPEAAKAGAAFLQVHVPRLLGLKALNLAGITSFNGLRTEFFNLPHAMPLRSYSYRAMENQGPADYRRALADVSVPLLTVVGTRDEAFVAEAFPLAMRHAPRGELVLVPDATHEGIVRDPRTMAAVHVWSSKIGG
jgi:alpha-beta hydrolase superfamily lysophospholipase